MTTYDAFISYSHAGDGRLAPRLQSGLERFARPVWKRRVLRVFRDETGLSASPHLWSSIAAALDEAEWFILLASPESAASEWVGREIEHWAMHRDVDRMLVVITDGTFVWDDLAGDIDLSRSTAAHPALSGVLSAEPRHIDFTWARAEVNLDRRDGRFQDALAELAAPLRGVAKDEIAGEDVRQHRRAMRLARSAVVGLAALTLAAVVAGVFAIGQRNEARAQRAEAEVQRSDAEAQRAEAEAQRLAAEQERERADAEALTARARGTSAAATAQANVALDRALLLGAAGVQIESSDDTMFGLLTALDAASGLVAFHTEPGAVEGVDVAPSGDQVATVDRSGRVRLWSFPDFEPLAELELGSGVVPYFIEYAAGGERIVVYADDALYEIDATEFEQGGDDPIVGRWIPDTYGAPAIGVMSRDGSLVATAGFFGSTVQVFDTATGGVVSTIEAPPECFGLRAVDLDEVTRRLAMVCENLVAVSNLDGGAVLARVDRFSAAGLLFSPDRSLLAVSFIGSGVELLDASTLELVERLRPAGTRIYSMDFTESGDVLVTGSDTGEVTVYALDRSVADPEEPADVSADTWEATEIHSAAGLDGGVFGVALLPDVAQQSTFGSTFVAGGPFGVTTWDTSAGPAMATARYTTGLGQFGYSAVDPARREVYRAIVPNGPWSADGRFDVITIDDQAADSVARTIDLAGSDVELLDIDGDRGLLVAVGVDDDPGEDAEAAGANPPARLVVQIADVLTGEARRVIDLTDAALIPPGLPDDVESRPFVDAALSPDGTKVLVTVAERAVSAVWEVATGALLSTGRSITPPYSWMPDSTGFVVGTLFGQLELYSSDFELLGAPMPNGDIGAGFTVSDVRTVSAIDEVIVTVESGNVWLVDPDSLETVGAPFRASGVQLQQSTVDDAGELLAAIDRDGRLRLWRVDDRSSVGPDISVGGGPFSTDIEFSGDDLIVDVPGLTAVIVPLDAASLVNRACELAGRELTEDEWRRYVGEMEQIPCR